MESSPDDITQEISFHGGVAKASIVQAVLLCTSLFLSVIDEFFS